MTEAKKTFKTTASWRTICSCWSCTSLRTWLGLPLGLVHRVPCGHEVIAVINFHKRFHPGPLSSFLLAHDSCHFSGIAVNSCHQSMAVGAGWGAIINVLHGDCFVSGVVSGQDQHHLPGFINLPISTAAAQTYSRKEITSLPPAFFYTIRYFLV